MIKTGNKEIDYILVLLDATLNNKPVPAPDGVDMNRLFAVADNQQIYSIIAPTLEKAGFLSSQESENWKNYKLSNLKKTIVVNNERESICKDLDAYKVKYMFLKGIVTREYYPETFMRQMSDNDIIYDETKRKDLLKIMKHHGYFLGASGGISDDFYKKPYATFEFHRTLFNEKEEFCPDFDVWYGAKPYGENSSRYIISRENHYLYTLGHMYKHYFCIGGCGIRFLCDLYLIRKKDTDMNWDYINKILDEWKINDFNSLCEKTAAALFGDGETDDEILGLINVFFEGNIYGKSKKTPSEIIDEHGGKTGYLVYRLFPPFEDMKAEYRTLKKAPVLLPAFYVFRLVDKFIHKRDVMNKDIKALKNK